jgi:hypothetical protein
MSEQRAGVKKGLGSGEDAVDRRIERSADARRNRRDARLTHVRKQGAAIAGAPEFSLAEFLHTQGAPHMLQALDSFLRSAPDTLLAERLHDIVFDNNGNPVLVRALVLMLRAPPPQCTVAMDCLVNLTGIITQDSPRLAACLLQCGLVEYVTEHAMHVPETWMIVANIMCLCEESRDALLKSVMFAPHPAPFVRTQLTSPNALALRVCAFMFDERWAMPPHELSQAVFAYAAIMLEQCLFPRGRMEWEAADDHSLLFALEILNSVAERAEYLQVPGAFLEYLAQLACRIQPLTYRVRVCRVLVSLGMRSDMVERVSDTLVGAMVTCASDAHPLVCREAILWLANFMSEDLEAVERCSALGAFTPLVAALRGHAPHAITSTVVYAYFAACHTCLYSFQHDMGARERANAYMSGLVFQHGAVRLLRDYCCTPGSDRATLDILAVWRMLYLWSPHAMGPHLEECGIRQRVDDALCSANTRIFEAAEALQRLLDGMEQQEEVTFM